VVDRDGDAVSRWRREGQAGFREYQLHVQLEGISPPIWRRLQVADSIVLPQLHRVLQVAFGWEDRHLHQFCVGNACFGEPDHEFEPPLIDQRGIRLNQLLKNPADRLRYEYDFGDGWDHEVLLEEMRASEEAVSRAQCLGGARAGPPEDSGGPAGYSELVSALSDDAHPQHGELKQWAGTYDAARFNLDEINRRLARLPKVRRPIQAR
jgi:Plasmid pRiA4b ORF-3-like protein